MLKILSPQFEREPLMSRFDKSAGPPEKPKTHSLDAFFPEFDVKPLNLWDFLAQAENYKLTPKDIEAAKEWFVAEFVRETTDEEGKPELEKLEAALDLIHEKIPRHFTNQYQKIFQALVEFTVDKVLHPEATTDEPTRVNMMKAAGVGGENPDPKSPENQTRLRATLIEYLRKKYEEKKNM